jgi:hypothetical protein
LLHQFFTILALAFDVQAIDNTNAGISKVVILLDEGSAAAGNRRLVTSLNLFVGQLDNLSVGKVLNARNNILN